MQRRAAGRASSRASAIGEPHRSHVPYVPADTRTAAASSSLSSSSASRASDSTAARSNAIVDPSGSCSSSSVDHREPSTIARNCARSDSSRAATKALDSSIRALSRFMKSSEQRTPRHAQHSAPMSMDTGAVMHVVDRGFYEKRDLLSASCSCIRWLPEVTEPIRLCRTPFSSACAAFHSACLTW